MGKLKKKQLQISAVSRCICVRSFSSLVQPRIIFVSGITHVQCIPVPILYCGRGKMKAHINWSTVIPEKAAPVAGSPVPADSRQ